MALFSNAPRKENALIRPIVQGMLTSKAIPTSEKFTPATV